MVDTNIQTRPFDFNFTYEYREGTAASPEYYEYQIAVAPDGSGEIRYLPDHPQNHPEEFVALFEIKTEEMDRLYGLMRSLGILHPVWNPPAGGHFNSGQSWLQVTAGGVSFEVRHAVSKDDAEGLERLFDIIRALVPQTIWDKIGELTKPS